MIRGMRMHIDRTSSSSNLLLQLAPMFALCGVYSDQLMMGKERNALRTHVVSGLYRYSTPMRAMVPNIPY